MLTHDVSNLRFVDAVEPNPSVVNPTALIVYWFGYRLSQNEVRQPLTLTAEVGLVIILGIIDLSPLG